MTYANHRDTENTEATQRSVFGPNGCVRRDVSNLAARLFCASFVFSVALWLTYVI